MLTYVVKMRNSIFLKHENGLISSIRKTINIFLFRHLWVTTITLKIWMINFNFYTFINMREWICNVSTQHCILTNIHSTLEPIPIRWTVFRFQVRWLAYLLSPRRVSWAKQVVFEIIIIWLSKQYPTIECNDLVTKTNKQIQVHQVWLNIAIALNKK